MYDTIVQLLPALAVTFSVVSGLGTMMVFARKVFRATWRGHVIEIRNYVAKEELYIDGRLEALTRRGQRGALGATLTGTIRHGDERIPVLVSLRAGLKVDADVYVDGVSVPVSSQRMGVFNATPTVAVAPPNDNMLAEDGRWRAASILLNAVTSSTANDEPLMALCDRAEKQLSTTLTKLAAIDRSRAAHNALPSAAGSNAEIDEMRGALDSEVARLLSAIQRLHIVTLRDTTDAEALAVRQLLSALTAETELATAHQIAAASGSVESTAGNAQRALLAKAKTTDR